MNRRSFLQSVVAAAVAAQVPLDEYIEAENLVITPEERQTMTDIMREVIASRSEAIAESMRKNNAYMQRLIERTQS